MIRWNPSEIEAILGCGFIKPNQEAPFEFHEAFFDLGGVRYYLNICPVTEHVWLRADLADPNQTTSQFEFSFRCDRIRTGAGGYDSNAVFFDFSDGDENVDVHAHCRLVMELLPNGNLYVWPVIGTSDQRLSNDHLHGNSIKDKPNTRG